MSVSQNHLCWTLQYQQLVEFLYHKSKFGLNIVSIHVRFILRRFLIFLETLAIKISRGTNCIALQNLITFTIFKNSAMILLFMIMTNSILDLRQAISYNYLNRIVKNHFNKIFSSIIPGLMTLDLMEIIIVTTVGTVLRR